MSNSKREREVLISSQSKATQEVIASRAYQKWCERGRPLWDDKQDWFAALAELEEQSTGRVSNYEGRASTEIKRGADLLKLREYEGTPLWVGWRYQPASWCPPGKRA